MMHSRRFPGRPAWRTLPAAVAATALLGACGGGGGGGQQADPRAAMQAFINDFQAKNGSAAWSLLSPQAQSRHHRDSFITSVNQSQGTEAITSVTENGDTATAMIHVTAGTNSETVPFTLVRLSGSWFVDRPY
jgi:hypothetical protein